LANFRVFTWLEVHFLASLPLEYYAERHPDRDQAIAMAYRTGAYSMQAIADHFGIGRMTVSRAVKRFETKGIEDGKWAT